jgi:hypothetical protein
MGKKHPRPPFTRKVKQREIYERFLIVCEGAKTEPNYFRGFRTNSRSRVIEVEGTGYNTTSLVTQALELKRDDDYDQVWCVFDKDSFSAGQVNDAFQMAERNGISIAYSNEAFELWYVLHFHYLDTGIGRRDYCTKLTALLGSVYQKNRTDMYELLEAKLPEAIQNATRLQSQYTRWSPAHDKPSTTVHLLVNELQKFARP